ncbi:hydrolase [Brachybacterium endophyticum]|uniref:Hydrolase n=1 Tax=Brachybacterium endophyticum TaxID=2182385 RepID=A0A2U2RQ91_9MICO|nr:hydrolase [Brachybacterium endophyticum]
MPVALAQIVVDEEPDRARERAVAALEEGIASGARLVVLPEATLAPFGTDLGAAARVHAAALDEALTAVAEEAGVVVVAGSFEAADDGRVHNTLIARGPDVHRDYRKIHLYDAFGADESRTIAPGEELALIEVEGTTVALATCYDIRFPEQFVALARGGADVIAVPMAWGAGPGKSEQLRVLQRARALDSTSLLVAADQIAPRDHEGKAPRGVGGTVAVSALGEVIAHARDGEQILRVDLDVGSVAEVRRTLPVLEGRPSIPRA